MALYNSYNDVQLKVGEHLDYNKFSSLDHVDIPDGIYVGYEGVAVVSEGKLQPELPLKDKWDRSLDPKEFLGRKTKLNLPCCQTIEQYFGEEVLELILKECAPDLEFIAYTLDAISVYLELKGKDVFSWQFGETLEEEKIITRIYTNPETDNSFTISYMEFP